MLGDDSSELVVVSVRVVYEKLRSSITLDDLLQVVLSEHSYDPVAVQGEDDGLGSLFIARVFAEHKNVHWLVLLNVLAYLMDCIHL